MLLLALSDHFVGCVERTVAIAEGQNNADFSAYNNSTVDTFV
jgi:hypothetical protein